jgi:putative transposase
VKANQAESHHRRYPVRRLCSVLGVSPSGYYDWRDRGPSQRDQANAILAEHIHAAFIASDEIYGVPKIQAELADQGIRAGENRIAHIMRRNHWCGVSKRRSYVVTTQRDKKERPAPDLVDRQFVADAPNQLWVADLTYVPTWQGFIFLAIVLDVWSRRVVGWKIGDEMTAQLVIDALNMAGTQRKPTTVIHHSDQGSQYTSLEFGKRCKALGVRPSIGSVGDAYDNAMAESFFASLECELLDRKVPKTHTQARLALFTYIEGWYNPRCRHGALGQISPANFETKHADQFTQAQSIVDLPTDKDIELETEQTT